MTFYQSFFFDPSSLPGYTLPIIGKFNEAIKKEDVAVKKIGYKIYSDYKLPKIAGTTSTGIVDSDLAYETFKDVERAYFKTLTFEKKYNKSSKDFYSEWAAGSYLNNDSTEWLNSYLKVWDKIKYENETQNTSNS